MFGDDLCVFCQCPLCRRTQSINFFNPMAKFRTLHESHRSAHSFFFTTSGVKQISRTDVSLPGNGQWPHNDPWKLSSRNALEGGK